MSDTWAGRRAGALLLLLSMLLLAAAPASAAPKPAPSPLPPATSQVGGARLRLSGELTDLPAGVPKPPAVRATTWLVADLDSREILAAKRPHVTLPTASTMKIFTALALAPRLPDRRVYTARPDDAAIDGTKVGLVPGSKYTVSQLLHGMIMSSGNDCANALGNAAGGQAAAVALIQKQAEQLGALDTQVRDTSGLDAPGQGSSAYDLALAGSAILQNRRLAKIMTTRAFPFPGKGTSFSKRRKGYSIQSHNKLLWNVPGTTGVKNGFTEAARGSFVGSVTRGGHRYIAVVTRAEGSTWREADTLLEWAFRNGTRARPVGTLVKPGEAVPAGTGVEATTAPSSQVRAALPAPARASSADLGLVAALRPHAPWIGGTVLAALLVVVLALRARSVAPAARTVPRARGPRTRTRPDDDYAPPPALLPPQPRAYRPPPPPDDPDPGLGRHRR